MHLKKPFNFPKLYQFQEFSVVIRTIVYYRVIQFFSIMPWMASPGAILKSCWCFGKISLNLFQRLIVESWVNIFLTLIIFQPHELNRLDACTVSQMMKVWKLLFESIPESNSRVLGKNVPGQICKIIVWVLSPKVYTHILVCGLIILHEETVH